MRLVAIGDIGVIDDVIHLGDEAMFEEFVVQARRRGIDDIVGVSANPPESAARYGIEAVSQLGFDLRGPDARERMAERRQAILAHVAGDPGALPDLDPARETVEVLRSADGLVITGGGNIASNWPLHVFERGVLGEIAAGLEIPLVVSGQTIGPVVLPVDRSRVATLLRSARLVGLREPASFELVAELGVDAARRQSTIDDASLLGVDLPAAEPRAPFCLVTLSTHTAHVDRAVFAEALARSLDELAAATGLEIVFLAHYGSLRSDVVHGDSVVHELVIDRLVTARARVEIPTDAVTAARLARAASLVVSSRYHPAVFAVSAAVPTVGIAVDDYTTVKLRGALGNSGQRGVLGIDEVVAGASDRIIGIARDADAITAQCAPLLERHRVASAAWWDRVVAELQA